MNYVTSNAAITKPVTTLVLLKRVDCVDGVAAYLEGLARGLKARGDGVVLVSGPVSTPDGSETRRDAILASVLEWIVIEDIKIVVPSPRQFQLILKAMQRHHVDLIAPQGFSVLPYASMLGRITKRPVVVNYHPTGHGTVASKISSSRSVKQRLSYRAICRLFGADRYIAVSREIETFYRQDCGLSPKRIHYQPFGVDDSVYREPTGDERRLARQTLDLPDDALVAVLSGRLNMVKGHDVAVDAIRHLRTSRPDLNIVVLFAGSGNQREDIERYTLQDDADRRAFRFLGFINNAVSMRQVYWAADILLLPSRFEGFALVVPEAMFCGAVPIRTPSGGWQDQIEDGANGYIVPFNDPAALADRIERLADTELLASMRKRAMALAGVRFTQRAMIEGTSGLFRALVSHATR